MVYLHGACGLDEIKCNFQASRLQTVNLWVVTGMGEHGSGMGVHGCSCYVFMAMSVHVMGGH